MRTGAIFARGSCRALKWLALVGVVFALEAGSAIAQPPEPRNLAGMPVPGSSPSATTGAVMLTWTEPSTSATVHRYEWRANDAQSGVVFGSGWTAVTPTATGREQLVDSLAAGTLYNFYLRAIHDTDGDGTPGEPAGPNQVNEISEQVSVQVRAIGIAPDVSFRATFPKVDPAGGGGKVALSWPAPTQTAAQALAQRIDTYQYRYAQGASVPATVNWISVSGTSVTVSGLRNGQPYAFEVRASNPVGGSATPGTGTATPATYPSMPQRLTATTPSDRQVVLAWSAPTDDGGSAVTRYEYQVEGGNAWIDVGTSLTATVSPLTPHQPYTFLVRARNQHGAGEDKNTHIAEVVATPTGPAQAPSAPLNLMATPDDKAVTLTWSAPLNDGGANITDYEYQVDGGTWLSGGPDLTQLVDGLTNGQPYTFAVRALNRLGSSSAASTTATPNPQLPGMPQGLTARAGDEQVMLSWTAPTTGGTPTGYQVRSMVDGRYSDWVSSDSMTGHTVMDLTNGTEYTFEVRARNDAGAGPEASATATPMAAPTVAGAPQNLKAAAGDERVTLSWTAPATGSAPTAYDYRVIGAGVEGGWKYTDNGTATEQTVPDLTNGTEYTFEVRAWNDAGVSAAASVKATPMAPDPGPQVTVKEVQAATSVAESGGLDVTVVATVPAGTKGADDKVAPIPSKYVHVSFPTNEASIKDGEKAEDGELTVLGSQLWEKITRTEKESEQTFKFRVAVGQDLDAENEKFQIEVRIDGEGAKSKVITIDDAEDQKFVLTLTSDHKEKNTIEEGDSGTLKLVADPHKTVSLDVKLVLHPDDPSKSSKYTLSTTSASLAARDSVTATVSAEADGDREPDSVTVVAYTTGALGNDEMLPGAELEITVADVNALPAIEAMLVDDKGKALDPQPDSVMEGDTVEVMLTVVDKDGRPWRQPRI